MIRKIGVICQDPNSFGFLAGVQLRLACVAELVEPESGALGKSTMMTRAQARIAVAELRRKGVDLIVRFTDADRQRWQVVQRHEQSVFPDNVRSIIVCGVAVENTEHWLALDRSYLSQKLEIAKPLPEDDDQLTGFIKASIARARKPDEEAWRVTARIVNDAPPDVFCKWLKSDESLQRFYSDCRSAAIRVGCEVPNELDGQKG